MTEKILIYSLLIATHVLVFWKTGSFDFINYDDPQYVYLNKHIITGLTWDNFLWALTSSEMGNWNPLTWFSYMLDFQLFGMHPAGFHLSNVFFHTLNTVLLCFALNFMTGCFIESAVTAALFGLHPLHIESVAWVSQRKDLLSATFFMITIIAYALYVRKPSIKRYLLVIAAFTFGLSAKPMLITLPLVLLLFDYWPLNRFQGSKEGVSNPLLNNYSTIVLEKLPLLLISVVISFITFIIQNSHGNVLPLDQLSITKRLSNVVISYTMYIKKLFWPEDLAIFYPLGLNLTMLETVKSTLFLLIVFIFVFKFRKIYPYLLTGWLWFIIMLIPVIGFLQVGLQSRADRYTYLPLNGIFIMIVWSTANLLKSSNKPHKYLLAFFLTITILSSLVYISLKQLSFWKDEITLYTHSLEVTQNNFIVHYNLAIALANKQRIEEAIFHYKEAIRTAPFFFEEAYTSLGEDLERLGRLKEAIHYYSEILRQHPDNINVREKMRRTMWLLSIEIGHQ